MKPSITFLLLIVSLYTHSQPAYDSLINRSGMLMEKIKSNTITGPEREELKKIGYSMQGYGFNYEEWGNDFKKSLIEIDKALLIWLALKDTLNEANLRKYKGMLLGYLHEFATGKAEIDRAIILFNLKGRANGVAVSQFDLSKVYEVELKYDSALVFAEKALDYWESTTDTFRILGVNNQLLNLFLKSKNLLKAAEIQKNAALLSGNKRLYWRALSDFYFLSYTLCEAIKNSNRAGYYKKLYTDKINGFKQNGISIQSKYAVRER